MTLLLPEAGDILLAAAVVRVTGLVDVGSLAVGGASGAVLHSTAGRPDAATCWGALLMLGSTASGLISGTTAVALPPAAVALTSASTSMAGIAPGAAGRGRPQKGTATMRSCRGEGVTAGVALTPPVMGAKGFLPAGLPKLKAALLCSDCLGVTSLAEVCILPVPIGLFSLFKRLQQLATVDFLLLAGEGLLPVLSSALPPMLELRPAVTGVLAALPGVAPSLRLIGATTPPVPAGVNMRVAAGVVACLAATASWRACAGEP